MDRIEALRLFRDVADAGSFSAVARRQSLSNSTVSLAVQQLEDELGKRLMTRSTRQLVLTHEGEALLADARRLVADWDALLEGLRDDGPLTGPIRVTATNDFGRHQLRRALDVFQDLHPGVSITLILDDTSLDLIENRIDLAIRNGPLVDSTMRARLLQRNHRVVCASPEYWKRHGIPKHPTDLADHNCLVLTRPEAPLASWGFRDGGKPLMVKVSGDRAVSDGDVLREWAVEGRGVVFKNRYDVHAELTSGTLVAVLEEFTAEGIDLYAVQPAGRASRRVGALVGYLVGVVGRG